MRSDEHRRRFRHLIKQTGPSIIRKDVLHFDSCAIFTFAYGCSRQQWEQRLKLENTSHLFRPDPFGVHDYHLDYSLNKRRRWMIPDEIEERIEEIQDPRLNLRVSASVHGEDRARYRTCYFGSPVDYVPCLEYHSVSRDGATITHRQSSKVETRLRNFSHPTPHPPRKSRGSKRRSPLREKHEWEGIKIPYDEELEYQPLHVNYTTCLLNDRPSLHNKEARRVRRHSPRAVSKKYLSRAIQVERDDEEDDNVEVEDADDVINSSTLPPVARDLADFVVRKEKRGRWRKKIRTRFVDENLKLSCASMETSEEEDFEIIQEIGAPSMTLSPRRSDCFARIPVDSVSELHKLRRLPCYPAAWRLSQWETKRVLGFQLNSSVIAVLRGHVVELREDSSATLLAEHEEDSSPINDDLEFPSTCTICYGEMGEESDNSFSHPFALSCSHLFCTGCWLSHIAVSMNRKKLPAACLNSDCQKTVSISAAAGLLSSRSHLLYERALITHLAAEGKLLGCPQCKRLHYSTTAPSLRCQCGLTLCTLCSLAEHFPVSCDVYRQYSNYLQKSGYTLSSTTSTLSPPIVSDLAKCPTCRELIQRSAGCNLLRCLCGASFCFQCSKPWTPKHHACEGGANGKVALIDVFKQGACSLLLPSLLGLAIQTRVTLLERQKELIMRLSVLPILRRIKIERIFIKLTLLLELYHLDSRRSSSSKHLAMRIRFALDAFFNTKDSQLDVKTRSLEKFHESISTSGSH